MAKILFNYLDYNHNDYRKQNNAYGGVGYYRLIKPAKFIAEQTDHEVDVMGKEAVNFGDAITNWDKVFQKYDYLWLASVYGEQNMSAIFYWAQYHKKKVIMDVDDNYLDLPESNLMHDKFAKGKKDRALFSASISLADVVTVSTEPLRDRLKEHFKTVHGLDKKIVIVPNMSDVSDWQYEPVERNKDKVVIGYPGSNSHQDDLVMIMPTISKLMKKYPNLYFELMGSVPKDKVKEYFGKAGFDDDSLMRISLVPSTDAFDKYPKHLSEQKWDIGIAPLVDTAFTRSKSHIKWMEYAMYKIPTVASRVYPYFMEHCDRQTIDDGFNGFLCTLPEWETKLEKLITNEKLRKEMGQNAYDTILKDWQYKDFNWKKVASQVLE